MAEKSLKLPAKQELAIKADGQFFVYVGSGGLGMFAGPANANARQLRIRAANEDRDITIRHADTTTIGYESHHVNISETLDDMPVETPAKHRGSKSLQQQIRELISRELHTRAKDDGYESLAEAEDFSIDPSELDDMLTPFEFRPMSPDIGDEEAPGASVGEGEPPVGTPEPEVAPEPSK